MRIDEINKVAEEKYSRKSDSAVSLFIDTVLYDLKNAFVEGALWSDGRPDIEAFHPSSEIKDLNLPTYD